MTILCCYPRKCYRDAQLTLESPVIPGGPIPVCRECFSDFLTLLNNTPGIDPNHHKHLIGTSRLYQPTLTPNPAIRLGN